MAGRGNPVNTNGEAGGPIQIDRFFQAFADEPYVLIKSFDPDQWRPGQDVDLLCADLGRMCGRILATAGELLEQGWGVTVQESASERYAQIDLERDGELVIRFDVMERVPHYPQVRLKKSYFQEILRQRQPERRAWAGGEYELYRPGKADDLLLRYVEYCQWFSVRPDKISHLRFILDQAGEGEAGRAVLERMFERLHQFTDLPHPRKLKDGARIGGWRVTAKQELHWFSRKAGRLAHRVGDLTLRTLINPVGMFGKLLGKLGIGRRKSAVDPAPRVMDSTSPDRAGKIAPRKGADDRRAA